MQPPAKKLLEQVQERLRLKHYSSRTEERYIYWIRQYILFHNKRHPRDMYRAENNLLNCPRYLPMVFSEKYVWNV